MLYLDSTLVGEAYARLRPASGNGDVLVLGLGDVHMSDEGLGVHVVHQLEREISLPNVHLCDGGFGGAQLLPELEGLRALLVVCSVCDGLPAGTISYTQPQQTDELPPGPGTALAGLKELVAAAQLLGRLPPVHLYAVSITRPCHVGKKLSPPIAAAMAVAACTVHGHAARLSGRATT
jgi:hydrogenase maturation protease